MNLNPADVLDPIFNTLDALIQNYGVYLYLVFVWLALAVIAWIFSGGLRKRMKGSSPTVIPCIIVMPQPPTQSASPIVDIAVEQVWDDDDEMTD
jgi:hypothetical protein